MHGKTASLIVSALILTATAAAVDLPQWHMDDWYVIHQQIGVSIETPEAALSLDISSADMIWTVADRGERTIEACPATYEVYRLPAAGTVTASGTAHIVEPVQIDLMIRLAGATVTSEAWVRTETLSMVRECLTLAGRVEVFLFGIWRDIGSMQVDLCIDFCPDMPDYQWPLLPGAAWSYAMNVHGTGHVWADLDLVGIPLTLDEPIAEVQSHQISVTVQDGRACTGLLASDALSAFTADYDYCEENVWFGHRNLADFASGDIFSIRDFSWEVLEAHVTLPTATPGPPTPTSPPATPTNLPATPTEAPTEPPPSPTPVPPTATPLPPTATHLPPTATPLPPTATPLPPTATPTPAPTTTPTPSPVAPTATPLPGEPDLDLQLNSGVFTAGDRFVLDLLAGNPGPSQAADVYVLLDVYAEYYFWPGWGQDVDHAQWTLPPWDNRRDTILDFTWPAGAGSAQGIAFHAALFLPGTFDLLGHPGSVGFSFE